MSIEIIGMVGTKEVSESHGSFDRGGRLFGFRESSSVGSERLQRQGADATSMTSGCGLA
jgi:hypothetical protein